jgi:redox-sensitive bicupin YhaK (pirin superfamily)
MTLWEVGEMPAITVDDLTVLERLRAPGLGDQPRPVWQVSTAPEGYEGEGFPVRRAFAGIDLRQLDPFVMMDQMGEVEYAPGEAKGTAWHPHRGFETVTYIIDGVFDHQDSHGGGGSITNGDTQWMTAGSGILHIEAPPEWLVQDGGIFHGIQLWVNLPRDAKMHDPRYQDIRSGQVALLSTPDAGALVRVIAGSVDGHDGPGSTFTPMSLVHATIEPGARLDLPWDVDYNALVYVLSGTGTVGVDGHPIRMGQAAVLGAGDYVTITADGSQESRSPKMDVIVVGGRPIKEPIAWAGPFVMNTKSEVMDAYTDFQKGRFGHIPA